MSETEFNKDEGVLLIDKPLNWTSFDVVKKIRNILKIKKVGHAGTLDPLASGLLVICTGKKTKIINNLVDLEKEYEGKLVVGKTTPSIDLETDFDSETNWDYISTDQCNDAANGFIGLIDQVPPVFSAIKVDGIRAYTMARQGKKPILSGRSVFIREFQLTTISLPEIEFRVVCSKGTYIRSLVRDFGEKLGSGAYLANLRRIRIGDFKITDALTIEQVQQNENLLRT